jgi:mRNA interferase RelE/StbE
LKLFYKVKYKKKAIKFIQSNKKIGLKFHKVFSEIAEDKTNIDLYDVKNIKGFDQVKRLRIGKYRAIFTIENDILIIQVLDIDSRGGIYK